MQNSSSREKKDTEIRIPNLNLRNLKNCENLAMASSFHHLAFFNGMFEMRCLNFVMAVIGTEFCVIVLFERILCYCAFIYSIYSME